MFSCMFVNSPDHDHSRHLYDGCNRSVINCDDNIIKTKKQHSAYFVSLSLGPRVYRLELAPRPRNPVLAVAVGLLFLADFLLLRADRSIAHNIAIFVV